MASKPGSHRLMLAGAYGLLVGAFLLVGVIPCVSGIRTAEAAIARDRQEIDTRQARSRELQNVKAEVELLDLETRDVSRLVPPNQDLGEFLKDLYRLLGDAGMKDVSVRNLAPTPLGRSQKLPVEVKGIGTYAQFQKFLVNLEHLDRLSSVGRLEVDASADMSGVVEVQVTLYIYSAKPS